MKLRLPKNTEVLLGAVLASYGETVARGDTPLVVVALGAVGLGLFGLKVGEGIGRISSGMMGIGALTLASLSLANFTTITSRAERDLTSVVGAVTAGPSHSTTGHRPDQIATQLAFDDVNVVVVLPGSLAENGCSSVPAVTAGDGDGPDVLAASLFSGTTATTSGAKIYSDHPHDMPWPKDRAVGMYKNRDETTGSVTYEPSLCS